MIICLEGVDNTGKTTLLKQLEQCHKYNIKVIYNDIDLPNVEVPQALLRQLVVKKEAFPFFYRNYKMLEYAKTIEKLHDFIFLDRGFLSTAIYNSNHCKELKIVNYAIEQYEHLVLYYAHDVPLKVDEVYKDYDLIKFNFQYKLYNKLAQLKDKKSTGYLINDTTRAKLYNFVINMLDNYKKES